MCVLLEMEARALCMLTKHSITELLGLRSLLLTSFIGSCFCFVFKTGAFYAGQSRLQISQFLRLTLNLGLSCVSFPSAFATIPSEHHKISHPREVDRNRLSKLHGERTHST